MMLYLIVSLVPKGPKSTSYNACLDQLIRGYDLVERETTYLKSFACAKKYVLMQYLLIISTKIISFSRKDHGSAVIGSYNKINSMAL